LIEPHKGELLFVSTFLYQHSLIQEEAFEMLQARKMRKLSQLPLIIQWIGLRLKRVFILLSFD
jgi:hypothetical protein